MTFWEIIDCSYSLDEYASLVAWAKAEIAASELVIR